MVGVSGFEPPTSWSQTMRASRCATPRAGRYYNREAELRQSTLLSNTNQAAKQVALALSLAYSSFTCS